MNVLGAVGVGLAAGLVGTAVLTISETVEARLTKREDSTVPGQVGAKLSGRGENPVVVKRLNGPVHWAHGITLGAVRGLIGLTPLGPVSATIAHYAVVWGGDVLLYRSLGIAEWPSKWQRRELVTDLFHKGVYAVATGVAFESLRPAVS
ncbi:hypothetical protein SAMN05216188_11959 [Lentzea xinjiangensis]|uniref:Uncharacterized protein n=1 Tax=Lentzea xinjiangensis TaxID=402600 RepID=A0A1H9TTK2_9PSEU|nr:hypothetical protein [Lentzea xinjiangensis]SES00429.1 hypothetical protein SAMN05216188_11959 [Lentzea xinjiangensis]